ncbi:MAG: preprotein translocase subunit SecG [Chitinispirillales bacterium]|jgi:preprotein translocase subunit SecG|nr:preprotein translocase subunit SecG [Chitinispirillales bacterium]
MIFGILLFLFLAICVLLCLLILVQSDKGGGISGALGGLSGANSFLGTQDTANVLTKGTYIFGSAFLALCILMTFFAPGGATAKSGMQRRAERVQSVTPMPVSAGGMGFADESAGAADAAVGGTGPTIIGDIIEGGVIRTMGEDGALIDVEAEPAAE